MRQLLQNASILLKKRLLLKNVSVDGYIRLKMQPTKNKSDDIQRELVLHFLVFIFWIFKIAVSFSVVIGALETKLILKLRTDMDLRK